MRVPQSIPSVLFLLIRERRAILLCQSAVFQSLSNLKAVIPKAYIVLLLSLGAHSDSYKNLRKSDCK